MTLWAALKVEYICFLKFPMSFVIIILLLLVCVAVCADAYYYQQFKKTLTSAFLIARKQATPLVCFLRGLLLAGVADLTDSTAVAIAIQGAHLHTRMYL